MRDLYEKEPEPESPGPRQDVGYSFREYKLSEGG
jgi:hypothetical protein